jgi:nitrite reductase/ring-hydroxylating ferredoxin subunit
MLLRREAMLAAAPEADARHPPERLGPVASLRSRLPLVVGTGRRAVRIVELDGALLVHRVVCPHLGGPLEEATVSDGVVTCPWHGYRFDVRSGASADGKACRLDAAPRVCVDADGTASLVWA